MSFTVICDECGTKQVFKNKNNSIQEKIEIDIRDDQEIHIWCDNPKCNNGIELFRY